MKRTIHVFYDNNLHTLNWLRTLVVLKKEFKEADVNLIVKGFTVPVPYMHRLVKIFTTKEQYIHLFSKHNYDIVMLAYHKSRPGLAHLKKEEQIEVLQVLRKHCNRIIWLDVSDSVGTSQFHVLPYVDKYLKKQLFKDKSMYLNSYYGGKYHEDYYHKNYCSFPDTKKGYSNPIDPKYYDKLGLSWNIGLGDIPTMYYSNPYQWLSAINRFVPINYYEPIIDRKYDVHFRGSLRNNGADFQRKLVKDLLEKRTDLKQPDTMDNLPWQDYMKEMSNYKSVISPYGWGEICYRDFECFITGATLIKPDMSFMETYPNWFIKNETYISVDWDFKELDKILENLKSVDWQYEFQKVALNGQNMHKEYFKSKKKRVEFVEHILNEIL